MLLCIIFYGEGGRSEIRFFYDSADEMLTPLLSKYSLLNFIATHCAFFLVPLIIKSYAVSYTFCFTEFF